MGSVALEALWAALLAVIAVFLVQAPRELTLERSPFVLNAATGPLEITVPGPFGIPQTYGDFDLSVDVELSAETELDIVFRKVEPHYQGVQFHGRFHVLRLSTMAEGPPYRTHVQALFGDEEGGVQLAPGVLATVQLQARGRRVSGNVAGRRQPWVETADDHGSVLFAVRGGKALLRRLQIRPTPPVGGYLPWLLAPAIVLAVSTVMAASGAMRRYRWSLLLIPIGAWASSRLVVGQMLPWTAPDGVTCLLLALWILPLSVALGVLRPRPRLVLASALAGVLVLELGCQREVMRLAPLEDPRLSLYFGEQSGGASLDALVGRTRSVTTGGTLGFGERRILFMGGRLLYEPLSRQELLEGEWEAGELLALHTTDALNRSVGEKVVAVVLPTLKAHSLQQLLLFRTFYLDLAPRALVYAVTQAELETVNGGNARRQLERVGGGLPSAGFVLGALLRSANPEPVATPEDLRQNLDELAGLCREQGIALALLVEMGLPGGFGEVVRSVSDRHGVPICNLDPREDGQARVSCLHDLLLPGLR